MGPVSAGNVKTVHVHTLVIGSGAAGLNATLQLRERGIRDVLLVTEGLDKGTSINTGSDKQTYYKLSLCGEDGDSPRAMAKTFFDGGGMHGDLALAEASGSVGAFHNLVRLGVPFPHDAYGQYVGYKTDHDPCKRATSIGPYTSREMCMKLIKRLQDDHIAIREYCRAVELIVIKQDGARRVGGAIVHTRKGNLEVITADNVVFAVGGPGGLYQTSVYPGAQVGAIGLGLMAGAEAQGLPESQYGLASTSFRWNVSGTYMQVVPRFISTTQEGDDPREFMREAFSSVGEMCSMVFLKGYQWPFDAQKARGGSSIIDILVYEETVLKGRQVFLDYRSDPEGFSLDRLSSEARDYLSRSGAGQATPLGRLQHMNPGAVALYAEHGIDLATEPLNIAVCAQHNNGGLAGNIWWESPSLEHLFPIGEVNGSHGVCRPGGSALNSGQVAGFRAAELIATVYREHTLDKEMARQLGSALVSRAKMWLERCETADRTWQEERHELQARMTRSGSHVREIGKLRDAVADAREQWARLQSHGCRYQGTAAASEALQTRQLCFSHLVYLDAIRFTVESGVGSRGSALVIDSAGQAIHPHLGDKWRMAPEDDVYRGKVLRTRCKGAKIEHDWVERRPIPAPNDWFETVWADYQAGRIYETR